MLHTLQYSIVFGLIETAALATKEDEFGEDEFDDVDFSDAQMIQEADLSESGMHEGMPGEVIVKPSSGPNGDLTGSSSNAARPRPQQQANQGAMSIQYQNSKKQSVRPQPSNQSNSAISRQPNGGTGPQLPPQNGKQMAQKQPHTPQRQVSHQQQATSEINNADLPMGPPSRNSGPNQNTSTFQSNLQARSNQNGVPGGLAQQQQPTGQSPAQPPRAGSAPPIEPSPEPPAGFYSARMAEKVQSADAPGLPSPEAAFKPRQPSSIFKSSNVDHTRSGPISRDAIAGSSQQQPTSASTTPLRSGTNNFTNPSLDLGRKVGMPGSPSPGMNRGSFKAPGPMRPGEGATAAGNAAV
jgi:DNA repair and recombination protein RAD52